MDLFNAFDCPPHRSKQCRLKKNVDSNFCQSPFISLIRADIFLVDKAHFGLMIARMKSYFYSEDFRKHSINVNNLYSSAFDFPVFRSTRLQRCH